MTMTACMVFIHKGQSCSELRFLSFRLKRVCSEEPVHCPDPTFADLVEWEFCMVNVRALHLWGEVRENLRTPVGAMLRLSGSSHKAMNSDSSVYNWEEESSFVPSKYRFVKISIWLDFYFLNMSVLLESILLNLIDFWLWVLSHMAAMNMNYTLLRGQKCQSFHIQKFVRYRKYETNKTKIDSIFFTEGLYSEIIYMKNLKNCERCSVSLFTVSVR